MDHEYRADGMFLIRVTCSNCSEQWDAVAMSQYRRLCDACEQVRQWENESSVAQSVKAAERFVVTESMVTESQIYWPGVAFLG